MVPGPHNRRVTSLHQREWAIATFLLLSSHVFVAFCGFIELVLFSFAIILLEAAKGDFHSLTKRRARPWSHQKTHLKFSQAGGCGGFMLPGSTGGFWESAEVLCPKIGWVHRCSLCHDSLNLIPFCTSYLSLVFCRGRNDVEYYNT